MMTNKAPCEECISFAICKSKSYSYSVNRFKINQELLDNCSILKDHILGNIKNDGDIIKELLKIRYLFRPDLKKE